MPSEIRAVTDGTWAGELKALRSTSSVDGSTVVIICWRRSRRHSRCWRCQLQRVSTSRSRMVQLALWRFAVLWWNMGMTFKVVCDTDASAGQALATRRGVGHVRHLDARLLWLQHLSAEGVVEVRATPGEYNEADLGPKMVGSRRMASLLKGTHLRPPMGWSSWDGGDDGLTRLQRQQNIAMYGSGT